MMGFACLRSRDRFFACLHRAGTHLIVKLPAARVQTAIAEGVGEPFAPNGRVFREWLAVPWSRGEHWSDYARAAERFVAEST